VHEQTTRDILVRAEPHFLEGDSEPGEGKYIWGYSIEIENQGRTRVQLLTRHWAITNGDGMTQHVRGDGVVGKQPVIEPGELFSYNSICPLSTPDGWMVGEYQMVDLRTGEPFEIVVPPFALDSPYSSKLAH
jgi:ApaG protein